MASNSRVTVNEVHLAMLLACIKRHGDIMPRRDAIRIYSRELVDHAVKKGIVYPTIINAKSKDNSVPSQRIDAIYINEWKRERPTWLDDYLAR